MNLPGDSSRASEAGPLKMTVKVGQVHKGLGWSFNYVSPNHVEYLELCLETNEATA